MSRELRTRTEPATATVVGGEDSSRETSRRTASLCNNVSASTVMTYGVVMPTGLAMRLLGHDLLRLRRAPDAKSYWIERKAPAPTPDSLKNQF